MLVWVITRGIDVKPAFAIWPTLLFMGVLDVGGMIAVTMAGSYTRPEFAAVTSSCFGLVTILLAWRLLGEKLTRAQGLGAVVVFCRHRDSGSCGCALALAIGWGRHAPPPLGLLHASRLMSRACGSSPLSWTLPPSI
jgi:hypothetical protein